MHACKDLAGEISDPVKPGRSGCLGRCSRAPNVLFRAFNEDRNEVWSEMGQPKKIKLLLDRMGGKHLDISEEPEHA